MQQLERLELLVGEENLNKIKDLKILILGLGGVGCYATESIVRCGIKTVIIVDRDVVDITNLNRQLIALHSTVGQNKTDVFEKRIKDINPDCEVIKITENIDVSNIELLFKYNPDYIIDACDTVTTKKELIRQCLKRKIKFISSMGTGKKLDPTKLEIIDIRKTSYDPLAKTIRKMVKDEKLNGKITVICSKEVPKKIESNIIASNSFVPSVAGLLCTSYVINDILK